MRMKSGKRRTYTTRVYTCVCMCVCVCVLCVCDGGKESERGGGKEQVVGKQVYVMRE
jgi:hypothetical protein